MSHLKSMLFVIPVSTVSFLLGKYSNEYATQQEFVNIELKGKNNQSAEDISKSSITDPIRSEEIDKLKSKILALENQLSEAKQTIINISNNDISSPTRNEEVIAILNDKISSLENQLIKQQEYTQSLIQQHSSVHLDEPTNKENPIPTTITKEEIGSDLTYPFLDLVASQKGVVVDKFKQFQSEYVDYEWAIDMEQKIKEYYSSHYLTDYIELESVNCKYSSCEIRSFDIEPNSNSNYKDRKWFHIQSDIMIQPWWTFKSSNMISGYSDSMGQYYYMLAVNARE